MGDVNIQNDATRPLRDDPLNAEELAAIRARLVGLTAGPWAQAHNEPRSISGGQPYTHVVADVQQRDDGAFIAHAREDVLRLLATVEARDAEIAALREIVAAVAAKEGRYSYAGEDRCLYCDAHSGSIITGLEDSTIPHTAECPVARARALLGKE